MWALHSSDQLVKLLQLGCISFKEEDPKLKWIGAFVPIPDRWWRRQSSFIPLRQPDHLRPPAICQPGTLFDKWKNQCDALSTRVQVHKQFFSWTWRRASGKWRLVRFSINCRCAN